MCDEIEYKPLAMFTKTPNLGINLDDRARLNEGLQILVLNPG
jgi:hypothetical protein